MVAAGLVGVVVVFDALEPHAAIAHPAATIATAPLICLPIGTGAA
jgi:hypothetical protein